MNLSDHLEKLNYFHEVARAGSLKKASETAFISQPSLTKSIKILESVVGSSLFIRLPRGVKLTREGELLYTYCQKLFSSITDIEHKLANPNDPYAGSIRIGTYDSIGVFFWPTFLQKFLSKHNNIDIELTTGRSFEVQKMIDNGEIDLALIVDPKISISSKAETLKKDSFCFYEAVKTRKVYKVIEEAPIIMMPTPLTSIQAIRELSRELGLGRDKKIYTTTSLESVKELTLSGIGIGLLPHLVIQSQLTSGKIKKVKIKNFPKGGIGPHEISVVYQRHKEDSLIIKTIIKEIKKHQF